MNSAWTVIPVLLTLAAVAMIGRKMLSWYRGRLLRGGPDSAAWTLEDLQKMRDAGQINQEEFKILREQVMQGLMAYGRTGRPAKSTSPGQPNDKHK